MKLFGYEFQKIEPRWERDTKDINKDSISFVDRDGESTAAIVSSSYSSGMYLDMMGNIKAEADLVTRYREMAGYPEMDNAIDEVTNESITTEDDFIVKLDLSKADMLDDNAKLVLHSIHNEILDLLDFQSKAYWIFRRWYIDGRLYYHCVTDQKHLEEGIKELRYIDPRKMREIKEIAPQKIPGAIDMNAQAQTMQTTQDYYLYNEKGFGARASGVAAIGGAGMATSGIRITKDSIIHVPSGLTDPNGTLGLGYLQKSIKILSQLKTMEDAVIIYRLSRAPERRVWYVDVGNLPKQKADQYVRKVMSDQKNKLIYNSGTGEIQDTRKFLCFTLDTKIPLLDGRTLKLQELINEYEDGKLNWVYSCDPITGKFVPGPVSWAGITKNNAEVVKITFDNGKSVTCTPDHKFPVWGEGLVEARHLLGKSVIPGYRRKQKINKNTNEYEQIYLNDEEKWVYTHREISRWKESQLINEDFVYIDENEDKTIIHHKDFNRFNNSPDNLVMMGRKDHILYHSNNIEDKPYNIKIFLSGNKKFYEERSNNEEWKNNIKIARKNQKNRFTKSWKVTTPEGEELYIDNLNEFCRQHDLNRSNIKYKNSRGYKAETLFNHKCISVELLPDTMDVGCITVDLEETYHSNHTYLLDVGVYTKNTMTEDYWLPKRADGSGTRVDTLAGGQNLGQMDDVLYFQKLLYNSLNVPIERLQSDSSPFQLGQDTQISRAEIKFGKFCSRLQQQFSLLFREALKKQCILKGLMSLEEFSVLEKLIKYEFAKDQHFTELKDQQILMMRANAFATMEQAGLIGRIYSMKWVRHEIFQQSDDDILEQTMEIIEDMQNPIYNMTNPASPQAQMESGGEEEEQEPEEEESDPGDEPAPEGSKNDHEQKIKRAKTVIDAIKAIPETKRTPNDSKKLRSAVALVAHNPKSNADK